MRFNLDNCDVLQITTRTQLQSKYAIHGQVQKNVTSAKYLGLNIYKTLSWDNHVNKVTQKAHKHQPLPSKHQRPMLFHTCKVIPGIRVYSLEPSKERTHQSDRGSLNVTPLEVRRNKACLVIIYRIVYDLVDLPPATYLQQS